MKHTHEETQAALDFVQNFSQDPEYLKNLTILYDYMTDLVELIGLYKTQSEQAIDNVLKAAGITGTNREARRKFERLSNKIQKG